jgi:hypothetical protein
MPIMVIALLLIVLQPQLDPTLLKLQGHWTGEGKVLNSSARVAMTWEWTLDQKFAKLIFLSHIGERRFEGHAYYRAVGVGRYTGTWFDNTGAIRPIEATAQGDSLVAKWGTAETEIGETSYRLLGDGQMEIVDRVQSKDGTWREFGRVRVKRN